jgi:hypothetical protein
MNTNTTPLIDTSHAAFITRGISISVSSCGADLMPSVARGIGCRVSKDRHSVSVLVSKIQAAELLAHVRERGVIAVAFSEPATHRTIQLKGVDAGVVDASADDVLQAALYCDSFTHELSHLGFDARVVRTLLACVPHDMARITFTPNAAFSQTPGPHAGQALLV